MITDYKSSTMMEIHWPVLQLNDRLQGILQLGTTLLAGFLELYILLKLTPFQSQQLRVER